MKTAKIIEVYEAQIAKFDQYLKEGKWAGKCPFCVAVSGNCNKCFGPFVKTSGGSRIQCLDYKPPGRRLTFTHIEDRISLPSWRKKYNNNYTPAKVRTVKPWMRAARADLVNHLKKIKAKGLKT